MIIDILTVVLTILPVAGLWATYKLWKWHKFYGTRFLWGLFIASIAVDFASIPVLILTLRRLILGPEAPAIRGSGELLGISLVILEGIFLYLVWRWRDLDKDMKRIRRGSEDHTSGTNVPPKELRK